LFFKSFWVTVMNLLFSTTEITSGHLTSDAPLHYRLLFAYKAAASFLQGGKLLEVGCGIGRGIPFLLPKVSEYQAIDKNRRLLESLRKQYPQATFISGRVPPLTQIPDNAFDYVLSFQVIEHIADDKLFVKELHRVLKPGGMLVLTTPNRLRSLTRNPWHVREYTAEELAALLLPFFKEVDMRGIAGNEKVERYHQANAASVAKWKQWDLLKLEYRLPSWMLRIPYEILNRMNRNRLMQQEETTRNITLDDYLLVKDSKQALDLFVVAKK
jgi:SAM-dependent methyltransferase